MCVTMGGSALLTAWEILRGVTSETRGVMSDCSCIRLWPFQGVTRFLKSMENGVTGLDLGGERVMCQAEHMCGGEHVRM